MHQHQRALMRALPKTFAQGALRSNPGVQISQARAEQQHAQYCAVLESILLPHKVLHLPAMDDAPDSCFVEDTTVVFGGCCFSFSLGHSSRRSEAKSVLSALSSSGGLQLMSMSAKDNAADIRMDGGDVLCIPSTNSLVVGIGQRTTLGAFLLFKQLVHEASPSTRVESIALPPSCSGALHLKSLCSMFGPTTLLLAQEAASYRFVAELTGKTGGIRDVCLVPDLPAANCLTVNASHVLVRCREEFPESHLVLQDKADQINKRRRASSSLHLPLALHSIDYSELAKADGALTCCSVLY